MRMTIRHSIAAAILAVLTLWVAGADAAEVFLRADTATLTMPDLSTITVWGYAQDSAFGALDGTVRVPGPRLVVPPGDTTLTIHLDNNLPEFTSVVIPGQVAVLSAIRNPDGRARSFTHETPPGNATAVDYIWTGLRPGSYIYQSGSHAAVQVQMGLYGPLTRDAAPGAAYPGILYDADVAVFLSELDPALHGAVATGNYGPGAAMTSTIEYKPKYFMINGASYPDPGTLLPMTYSNQRILLRFFNAGLEYHSMILQGAEMALTAEDGNPLPYAKAQYAAFLPPGKTLDAVIESPPPGLRAGSSPPGTFALYDRGLSLTNNTATGGGMLAFLNICNAAIPAPVAVGDTLMLSKSGGSILFKWTDVAGASAYNIYEDTVPNGSFATVDATAASGATGVLAAVPAPPAVFFKVAGANCMGQGPL